MKSFLLVSTIAIYAAAALMRTFLAGYEGWLIGLLAFHVGAAVALRVVTNATRFAACTALCGLAAECALLQLSGTRPFAVAAGTLFELLPAVYFARRFFLTIGD
jgi:hypothetical protein